MSTKSTIAPMPFAEIMAMTLPQIAAEFRRKFVLPGGKALTMAKMIVAMERKKEGKGSIAAWMRNEFGEIDANAYKPARVFRDLVELGAATAGAGKILEAEFDRLTSISAHILASSILGLIEKHREENAAVAHKFTADLCRIIAAHENDGDTIKKLKTLKDLATPDKDSAGTGEGEGESAEPASEEAPLIDPLALLALLKGEKGKVVWRAIATYAKENADEAAMLREALQIVSSNADKVATLVATFIPAPATLAA